MKEPRRTHLEAIPPVPAILGAIVSVQAGAALAKGLFPALGPIGTVGLRVVLSAVMLMAAFRPGLRALSPAQWRAVIPYGLILGTMNIVFYLSLSRIPLGVAVTVEFIGPLAVAVFGSRRAVDIAWDCTMPHVNGLEATGESHRALPSIEGLIITGAQCRHTLVEAYQSAARGCLLKSEGPGALLPVLESVLGHHRFRSHGITRSVRRHLRDQRQTRNANRPRKRNRLPHRRLQIDQANRREAGPQHQNNRDASRDRLRLATGAFGRGAGALRLADWPSSFVEYDRSRGRASVSRRTEPWHSAT